eukprot:3735843-Pyramimonas_sp.AAC.1
MVRQGRRLDRRVWALIVKALPVSRLRRDPPEPQDTSDTNVRTSFSATETAPSDEQRMNALVERIRVKETTRDARSRG